MSVIGIDKEGVVWGASSRFINSMLLHFIQVTGQKKYLVNFQDMFEHMYNAIDLTEISVDEMNEFRDLVAQYILERGYAAYVTSDGDDEIIKQSLMDLVKLIDAALVGRRAEA